uniref:Uncharacterized protein n=1 Tax=Coccidioides posadasii RMSCC 3488 TaxID=454284 RepID=A0A0J6FK20_COCPO|nr:hypothetical protein CPAG_06069 [Coccidioides posadasii RMSCC 3488]
MPSREISLHDKLVTQIQALALISYGISILDVSHTLQIPPSTLYDIQNYVEDAPRSGWPKEISTKEAGIIASVTKSCSGREKSTEILVFEAEEEQFVYGEDSQKLIILLVYAGDGRSPQISYFRAALHTRRRDPAIFGNQRLQQPNIKLKRNWMP